MCSIEPKVVKFKNDGLFFSDSCGPKPAALLKKFSLLVLFPNFWEILKNNHIMEKIEATACVFTKVSILLIESITEVSH